MPDSLPGVFLTDDVRLASVLEEVSETDTSATYRCPVCGQMWECRYPAQPGFFKI